MSGARATVRPVMTPCPSSHSAITVYDEPGRNPRSVNAPDGSVVVRTTLPPAAPPTASRTRAPATGSPRSSTTRPEILPSGRDRRSGGTGSVATDAPGSPVTTGSFLSPTEATVRIFDDTPSMEAHPATQHSGAIRRRRRAGEIMMRMAVGSSS